MRCVPVLAACLMAAPALAEGYIETKPETSAGYRAAMQVADQGCSVKAMDWANLVLDNGGVAGDAVDTLKAMRAAGEAEVQNETQSFRLVGVFGC